MCMFDNSVSVFVGALVQLKECVPPHVHNTRPYIACKSYSYISSCDGVVVAAVVVVLLLSRYC